MITELQNMRFALDCIEQKKNALKIEISKIKMLCDREAPVYYAERKEIEAACNRALRALEEP